jgi:hypothetical protein
MARKIEMVTEIEMRRKIQCRGGETEIVKGRWR